MATNGEWLDYLAQNAPDELAAWFDAEHVEHQERALDGNTEPESSNTDAVSERYATAFRWLDRLDYGKGGVIGCSLCDTPEQGEVVMPLESWREYLGTESESEDSRERLEADVRNFAEKSGWLYPMAGTRIVLEWLDRQAAITAEETSNAWEEYRDATQREIAELTAERDKLQEQLLIGWECECRLQAERELYREALSQLLDTVTDGMSKVSAILDNYDEGMA